MNLVGAWGYTRPGTGSLCPLGTHSPIGLGALFLFGHRLSFQRGLLVILRVDVELKTARSYRGRLTPFDSNWNLAEAATSSFAVSWELNVWVRLPHASATFAAQRREASSLAGDLRILAPQHSQLCTKPRSLKKPEFLTATYFSLSFSTEGGGAGDSGVGAVFCQQQRDFAAARIDGPLRQFVLHAGEELAHQLRHAAAEYDDVGLQQIDHIAEPHGQ